MTTRVFVGILAPDIVDFNYSGTAPNFFVGGPGELF